MHFDVTYNAQWGERHPATVLHLDECQVLHKKTIETDGYTALQLGVGEAKASRVNITTAGQYTLSGATPKRKVAEFTVTPDALLPEGTKISALHFVPGQLVDVCGISKGKGFQGVMKKWNFKGGRATHGNSLSHRVPGSTGMRQDPGRVHIYIHTYMCICKYIYIHIYTYIHIYIRTYTHHTYLNTYTHTYTHTYIHTYILTHIHTYIHAYIHTIQVFKNKKMPGRMGSERTTMQNLFVLKVDPVRDLVYVKGAVPGNAGTFLRIVDAVKGPFYPSPPPFPTYTGDMEGEAVFAPMSPTDRGVFKVPDDPY